MSYGDGAPGGALCRCCEAPSDCERCTGCAGCLGTVLCPCIALGKLAKHAPRRAFTGAGDACQVCCLSCLLRNVPFSTLLCFEWPMRRGLRPAGYDWEPACECLTLWFCGSCAIMQELNIVAAREDAGKTVWTDGGDAQRTVLGPPRRERMEALGTRGWQL